MRFIAQDRLSLAVAIAALFFAGLANAQQDPSGPNVAALDAIFTEKMIAANTRLIHSRAMQLSPAARYPFLADWVLPNSSRDQFRLQGYFAHADSSPEVLNSVEIKTAAPALELIRVAKETNQLSQLTAIVESTVDGAEDHSRGKAAMLALLYLESGDSEKARQAIERLTKLVADSGMLSRDNRWAELLAGSVALRFPALDHVTREMLSAVRDRSQHAATSAMASHVNVLIGQIDSRGSDVLQRWQSATAFSASTHGNGHPPARWRSIGGEVTAYGSENSDYLFYRAPLSGKYEVECELSGLPNEQGQIQVAGRWVSFPDKMTFLEGSFQQQLGSNKLEPPRSADEAWIRCRVIVDDQQVSTYMNGRLITERHIDEGQAHWVAIINRGNPHRKIRNVRIIGTPTVPQTIFPLRNGRGEWQIYDHDQRVDWSIQGGEGGDTLIANRCTDFPEGCRIETLLQYQRPVFEDGDIEYEYFYEAGQANAAPAIDRTVFLLEPEGVRLHSVSDGKYERHPPDQTLRSGGRNRITNPIALLRDSWNRVRLSFRGDTVVLFLNGEELFKHQIAAASQRMPGLFYFPNQSSMRIRNMAWTGKWPTQIPSVGDQQLAMPDHEPLVDLEHLTETSVVSMNKAKDMPDYLVTPGLATSQYTSDGVLIETSSRSRSSPWQLKGRKRYHGDLDATLTFSDFAMAPGETGGELFVAFNDEHGNKYAATREYLTPNHLTASSKLVVPVSVRRDRISQDRIDDGSTRGRVRLVRRGNKIHCYAAPGDSEQFYHIFSRPMLYPKSSLSVSVEVNAMIGERTSATLENLVIRSQPSQNRSVHDPQFTALTSMAHKSNDVEDWYFKTFDQNKFSVDEATSVQASNSGLHFQLAASGQAKQATVAYRGTIDGDFQFVSEFTQMPSEQEAVDNPFIATFELMVANEKNREKDKQQISITVDHTADGAYHINAHSKPQSGQPTAIGKFESDSINSLRFIRIQSTLFCLCSGKANSRLLGYVDLGNGQVVPDSIRFTVAAPEATTAPTQLWLKSLKLNHNQ